MGPSAREPQDGALTPAPVRLSQWTSCVPIRVKVHTEVPGFCCSLTREPPGSGLAYAGEMAQRATASEAKANVVMRTALRVEFMVLAFPAL